MIDEQKIQTIVKTILENDAVNSDFIPDVVEKKMYENVIKIVLGVLHEVLENAEINILGHTVKARLE